MRPLRLVVQAFGPYADVQIFDFRELGDHTFFLIHGDTGAGKSTILDAICYALYGDSSGGERTGLQLRSHHAPVHRKTSVSFDFAIGANCYRVSRSPEHERSKLRGSGTVTDPQSAHLWLRNSCKEEHEDGEILAERWEQVNQQVVTLMGFQCNQFRQVVILPQGQFREFLVAPSADREAILSVLFRTNRFHTIELALKKAAAEIEHTVRGQGQRLSDLYRRAGVTDLVKLQQEHDRRKAELDVTREQQELLRTTVDEAYQQLQEGREAKRRLSEREQAELVFAELNAQQAEIDGQKSELDQGRRAAALADVERTAHQRLVEADGADQELQLARVHYDAALVARKQAQQELVLAERRVPEIEQARQELTSLQEIAHRWDALEQASAALRTIEQNVQGLVQRRSTLQASLSEAQVTLLRQNQTLTRSRELVAEGAARQLRLERAQEQHQQRERLDRVVADLTIAKQAERNAKDHYEHAVSQQLEAQRHLEQVEYTWYAGQAGVLAQKLVPGLPCPVCGSHEHPMPAVASPDVPTETDLKHHQDAVRKLQALSQELLLKLTSTQRALDEKRAEQTLLMSALGEQSETPLKALQVASRKAADDVEEAQQAQSALFGYEKETNAAQAYVEDLTQQLTALETQLKAAESDNEAARAICTERERHVPEHLRSKDAIQTAATLSEQTLRSLSAAVDLTRKQTAEAEIEAKGAEVEWSTKVEASTQARQRAHEQQLIFVERLISQGFVDREAYAAAKRPTDVLEKLALRITEYEHDRAIAGARLDSATKAAEGVSVPNLDALEVVAEQARQDHETSVKYEATLLEQYTQSALWCSEAGQLSLELEHLKQRYQLLGEVARIANGDNPYRMSFQRFVLAALLDEVLVNASHRLQVMSRGRYTLQRALGQLDRRSAGGLELEVLDFYTGRARLAKTLSGGESFLASLALALGLADVVQSETGGIHLETMFVDEGFGSLDDRTLDQAVETLAELQQGGRLVGIISHVTELQRRIAARLEVQTSPSGSTARFVVGSVG